MHCSALVQLYPIDATVRTRIATIVFMATNNVIPPINFGCVEDGLFRSGQPNALNFPFLERLQLRTVVFLAPEEPNQRL